MSGPLHRSPSGQHNLRDWLDLHEINLETCRRILDAVTREEAGMSACQQKPDVQINALDPDGAWMIVTAAVREFLPEQKVVIEETSDRCEKISVVGDRKSRRALTIDHGPEKFATIIYDFSGDPSDLLTIAHEFGHALQIRASEGKFMPPVMREVCAFLCEGALLTYCRSNGVPVVGRLLAKWEEDNRRYLGTLAKRFEATLEITEAIYRYSWNYPIARYLALRILRDFSRDRVWRIFEGELSVKKAMEELAG